MKKNLEGMVIFVIGVSGTGKTLVSQLLARDLSVPFFDADDHHPKSNINKMTQGIPLNDKDRQPWLDELNRIAIENIESGCVMACSALKQDYRDRLSASIEKKIVWIYLSGTYDQVYDRMINREGHFMKEKMLMSQFETLEEPPDAVKIDISKSPTEIIHLIKSNI